MKQMIDEILKKESDLKNSIEEGRARAEVIKREADRLALESINQALQEGQKESEALLKRTEQETKETEKETLKEIDARQEFKVEDKRIEETASRIISQYLFKEK